MPNNYKETIEKFGSIFRSKIVPKLAAFEEKRKSYIKRQKKFKILTIIVSFTFLYFTIAFLFFLHMVLTKNSFFFALLLPITLILGLFCTFVSFAIVPIINQIAEGIDILFSFELKNSILPIIFSPLGDFKVQKKQTSVYDIVEENCFDVKTETESIGINFMTPVDYTDDVITGTLEDKKILIAEGKLTKGYCMPYDKILVIKLILDKNLYGKTVLKHKYSKNNIDIDGLEKIVLEDAEILKKYNIYSTCQIESRCFLEPTLITKINEIKKRIFAHSIDFILCENIFYTIINSNHDYFELGSLHKFSTDEWTYKNALKELHLIIKLINYFEF